MVNNARFIGDRLNLTPSDILCCPPPLFHCFGLVLGLLAVITHGGKTIYPSETFDAPATLQVLKTEGCTALHGVPAMFDSLFSLSQSAGGKPVKSLSKLRTGIIAGSPVPKHLMESMMSEFGMTEFTSSYGVPAMFDSLFSLSQST